MQTRPYGTSGDQLSILGFGGIVVTDTAPEEAARLVAHAVDCGVNYFDVAPTYGNAEERLGPALEPYRNGVFLACKSTQRRAAELRSELERSLRRLRTEHFDLYQLHAVNTPEDLDQITGPSGALDAAVAAREEGLVRHIGFSSHSVETALALLDAFQFDSVLFPINWMEYLREGFGPQVVERAAAGGVTRLALKALAYGKRPGGERQGYSKCWYQPIADRELAGLALRFALSQPITAAIPPGEAELFQLALDVAADFTPITASETEELRRRAAAVEPIFQLEPA